MPVPRPLEDGEPARAEARVVDRAVLAERRARRAELAEQAAAGRAARAEAGLARLGDELAERERRLEAAAADREAVDDRLRELERELRAAEQRLHAERRCREEALRETTGVVRLAHAEVDRVRRDDARLEALRRQAAEADNALAAARAREAELARACDELRERARAERALTEALQAELEERVELQRRAQRLIEGVQARAGGPDLEAGRLAAGAREALAVAEGAMAQAHASAHAARAQLDREDRERAERDAQRARELRTLTQGLERLRDDGRALRVRLQGSLAAEREASRIQVAELTARLDAVTGREAPGARGAPWLARALPRLARSDPAAAAALLVGLVPAQRPERTLDYDLDVAEWGSHAVTVGPATTSVRRLPAPRPDREVDFRLELDARALAALLVHGGPAARRRCARLSVRATRRRRAALRRLPPAALGVEALQRAGVRPDPFLALAALCQLVGPDWTRGERLWVGWELGGRDGTWYAGVQEAMAPVATRTPPAGGPQAVVRLDAEAFRRVVLGGGPPHAQGLAGLDRSAVRGDMRAVALLLLWLDWARAGGPAVRA